MSRREINILLHILTWLPGSRAQCKRGMSLTFDTEVQHSNGRNGYRRVLIYLGPDDKPIFALEAPSYL